MSLQLMYITNREKVVKILENSGIDRLFIDLETIGKDVRQHKMDTVKSNHCLDDIKKLRPLIKNTQLLVRINKIHDGSKNEIEKAIEYGADILMLPYFKTMEEVKFFIETINKRVKIMLLVETIEAENMINELCDLDEVDEIHIGLNDLHLEHKLTFMFELLSNGTVDKLCNIIKKSGKKYGFGGIARLGYGELSAEMVIAEHYRLGSSMAILSRSFCDAEKIFDESEIEKIFGIELKKIRDYEETLTNKSNEFFEQNHQSVCEKVAKIIENKKSIK